MIYFWDITEHKRVQDELSKALAKEHELNELKSGFIPTTSHEFRTPLTTISASVQLLQSYIQSLREAKKAQVLHRIELAVKYLVGLLDHVLLIGKSEAGKLEVCLSSLDVVKFCENLVEELEVSVAAHNAPVTGRSLQVNSHRKSSSGLGHKNPEF